MMNIQHSIAAAFLLAAGTAGTVWAALPVPAPTPAQQQAAAAKKAQADAQAAKDKDNMAASMDTISARWRGRAAQQGWKTHAPTKVAAAASTPAAGAGLVTAAGAAAPQAAQQSATMPNPIVKSEKFGTAPPSEDHKAGPTRAEPRGIAPTVQKGSPENVSKK